MGDKNKSMDENKSMDKKYPDFMFMVGAIAQVRIWP